MSQVGEAIIVLEDADHDKAVDLFAQTLADCESTNWTVAQQAHEYCAELTLSMGIEAYELFLTEATECMVANDLEPRTWLPG